MLSHLVQSSCALCDCSSDCDGDVSIVGMHSEISNFARPRFRFLEDVLSLLEP